MKRKALILVRNVKVEHPGGTNSYYLAVSEYLKWPHEIFNLGGEQGLKWYRRIWHAMGDYIRFARVMFRDNSVGLVLLNPSLDRVGPIRDSIFLLIAKVAGKRVVVFFRGWNYSVMNVIERYFLFAFRRVYFSCDAFIVLASSFKEILKQWGFHKPIYIETTTCDIRLLQYVPAQSFETRKQNVTTILYLGNIVREKGVFECLEIHKLLRDRGISVRLMIAGSGKDLDALRQRCDALGLDNVHFLGYVSGARKAEVLNDSDIFLFPSRHGEGMPNAVLEAISFGLAVVTTPVGGLGDFFENGKMGYVTDSTDASELAPLVERLVHETELRSRIRNYNMAYARESFTSDVVASRLDGIVRDILSV